MNRSITSASSRTSKVMTTLGRSMRGLRFQSNMVVFSGGYGRLCQSRKWGLGRNGQEKGREGAKTRASVASAGLHCGQYSEASRGLTLGGGGVQKRFSGRC